MAEDLAADVVLVVVGHERADDFDAVLRGPIEQSRHVPGGIDHEGLPRAPAADQVGEVLHVADQLLHEIEIVRGAHGSGS